MKKAVIILPTYNEAKNIEGVVEKIFEVAKKITGWEVHVTVVDSTSPDKTGEIVQGLIKRFPNSHIVTGKHWETS